MSQILTYTLLITCCLTVSDVNCSPQHKQVVEGQSVSFTCTLTERWPFGDIKWVINWSDNVELTTDAATPQRLVGSQLNGRGEYRTTYNSVGSGAVRRTSSLTIDHVTSNDKGQFKCVHDGWVRNRGTFFTGILTVTVHDKSTPDCVAQPNGNNRQLVLGDSIELTCRLRNGTSKTRLSWFRGDDDGHMKSAVGNVVIVTLTLQGTDNGISFICKNGQTQRQCLITPFERSPNVTLSNLKLQRNLNGLMVNGSFECCGTGLPRIDRYDWTVNGSLITGDEAGYRIDESQGCSELYIFNITSHDNLTQVQCEVTVPVPGLSSSAIATIVLSDAYPTTAATVNQHSTTDNIIRQMTAASGTPPMNGISSSNLRQQINYYVSIGVGVASILVIGIIIIVVILYIRRRRNNKRTNLVEVSANEYQLSEPKRSSPQKLGNEEPGNATHTDGMTYASLDLQESPYDNEILHPDVGESVTYADIRKT